ncbi:hypothetical protein ACFSUS_12040 [Spirosoma soli]|uniref:Protein BatD n=1 Tax=Spirosoma soli TaxID=1770529 RepID=A0ABW5M3Z4_9BACT
MSVFDLRLWTIVCLITTSGWSQSSVQPSLPVGRFLTDSIEIGRPFRYALTYRHAPRTEILFPDTAQHFAPYRVEDIAVFATQTTGTGFEAISRDSAVYTLVSFETDSIQLLQVPIRIINATDCTALLTQVDTVFLRSKLTPALSSGSAGPTALTLATSTQLAPLRQQFNYPVLGAGVVGLGLIAAIIYGLFGRAIRRLWRIYQLNRRHERFLREYNRLSLTLDAFTAAETANQAIISWKAYLEELDRKPYASLTTSELAERMNDERVTSALREADQMIYGGAFTPQSQPALRVLADVATQAYHRRRAQLQASANEPELVGYTDSAESSPLS